MFDLDKLLRSKDCMTRYRLSKLTGLSQTTLATVGKGDDCNTSTLKKICEVLDVKLVISYEDINEHS